METYVREIELDLSKERHDEAHEIVGNTIVNLTPEYEIYIKLDDPTNQPINISYIQKLTNASFSRIYITNSKQNGIAKLLVGTNFDVDLVPRYIDEVSTVLTDSFTRIITKTGINELGEGETLYSLYQQTDEKIRFETVKITSTEKHEVYLELDSEGRLVLSADKVIIHGDTIIDGTIVGSKLAFETITTELLSAGCVTTEKLAVGSVTADKIASNSITSEHIQVGAIITDHIQARTITTEHIQMGAITTELLSASCVTAEKLAVGSVTADKIASNSITSEHIQAGAITTNHIKAGAITTDKLSAGSVTAEKLAILPAYSTPSGVIAYWTNSLIDEIGQIVPDGYTEINLASFITLTPENAPPGSIIADLLVASKITSEHIQTGAITTELLSASCVTAEKLAVGSVTADKIASNSITSEHIQAGAITTNHIKAGAITTELLSANCVTAEKLASESVTTDKIASNSITSEHIQAGAITTNHIKAGAITTELLSANCVTAEKLAVCSVTADKIAANSITSEHIQAGAITTDKLSARSVTVEKLAVLPSYSIPSDTIAYWTNSLIDEINGIIPDGYTEINLAPFVTLTPENAPEGSVVADLLAGNVIYASKRIEVGEGSNRWAVDGTHGLTRVLNNTDFPLMSIIHNGTVTFTESNKGEKLITLPYKLQKYFVMLDVTSDTTTLDPNFQWKSYIYWEDASTSSNTAFKIKAYYSKASTTGNDVYPHIFDFGDGLDSVEIIYRIPVYFPNPVSEVYLSINFYGSNYSSVRQVNCYHSFSSPRTFLVCIIRAIRSRLSTTYEYKIEIEWDDGVSETIPLFSSSNVYTTLNATLVFKYPLSVSTVPFTGTINYYVVGY
jgi:hypothetical protein